jgi:HSP20 family molecular chaperone IbpA
VAKEDVAITLLNNQELIIKGVKKQPRQEREPLTYYLFEREFGTFYKKIVIDFPLDTTQVKSLMENGVLTIEVRKRGESKIAVEIK